MRAPVRAIAALLWAIGCRPGADVPADFSEQLATFRAGHEAEIGGAHGPLSTVDAWYVEPGHRLSIRVQDGRVVHTRGTPTDPIDETTAVAIDVRDDGIECTRGCATGTVTIDAPREVEVPPFSFGLSAQSGGLRVLVHDPSASARASFQGLPWYPPTERWWLAATLEPTPDTAPEPLSTTRGLVKPMRPAGTLQLRLPGGEEVALVAYEAGADELLVPFTDATNGDTTYDVGRYLTVPRSAPGEVVVDFNRATNPWCAYSEHYNCPIPPAQNRIARPVDAGERRYR